MKRYIMKAIAPAMFGLLSCGLVSCVNDLDTAPISPKIDTEVSNDGLFNKCYANFAIAGNGSSSSGDDDCDVKGYDDAGMTGLVRLMWNVNELPTDEAICSWGDNGVPALNFNTYDNANGMTKAYFARLTLGISSCNQYLKVAGGEDATKAAEIRFLRAMQYYLLMDAFGNVPFSENVEKPVQMSRKDMYEWLVNELTNNVEPNLSAPQAKTSDQAGYGRVDKAACWMLLARLYLNAEAYTGKAEWSKAKDYAKKVMTSGYELNMNGKGKWSAYQMLFMADNGETNAAKECLFPIIQNTEKVVSYGNSFFLTASTFNGDMHANPDDLDGTNGCVSAQWAGNRARPELIKKFFPNSTAPKVPSYEMTTTANDDRAIFCGEKRNSIDINNYTEFKDGYGVCKFINYFTTDGKSSYNPAFSDADYFFLRVAEAYLTYAEADARLNGNNTTGDGTDAINKLRQRANTTTREGSYSLNEICDEWSREFYFEGIRRTTLVRFNRFGGNTDYTWEWKGGEKAGKSFDATKNIYAIPVNELQSNGNLKQNPGY